MSRSDVPPPLPTGDGTPFVAVSFDDTATVDDVAAARDAGMDVAEVRIDRFDAGFVADDPVGHLAGHLAPFASVPTIATVRSTAEGGGWDGDDGDRLVRYRAALGVVGAVDVELGSSICADVVTTAHDQGRTVIGSFHDFERTPGRDVLEATLRRGDELGVDVVKVATTVDSPDDVRTLTGFLVDHHQRGLIVIGMGSAGSSTRVAFPFLGSRLTFAAVGAASAPGQLPLEVMADTFRSLSPTYAARHPSEI